MNESQASAEPCISPLLVQEYLKHRTEVNHSLGSNSRSQLRYVIDSFNQFMFVQNRGVLLSAVKRHHFKEFMTWGVDVKRWKPSTVAGRLYQLRRLFVYCVERGIMVTDPTLGVEAPIINPNPIDVLTHAEWEMLLDSIQHTPDLELRLRNLAVFVLASFSAATLENIHSLTIDDLNLPHSTITFQPGNRVHGRTIRLPQSVVDALDAYLAYRRSSQPSTDGATDLPLFDASSKTIRRIVTAQSERLIGRRIGPEILRSSRILHLIQSKVPLGDIGRFTGVLDLNRFWRYMPALTDLQSPIELWSNDSLDEDFRWFPAMSTPYLQSFNKRRIDHDKIPPLERDLQTKFPENS